MTDDPRVLELLEVLLDSGCTPEDVCRDTPELLPELCAAWHRVRALEAEIAVMFPESSSADDCAPPLPANVLPRIPGYEVRAVLGHGGIGVVYKASHVRLNRHVALKMLLAGPYARPKELKRFLREAEAVAGLRHANIVHVYDAGELDGRPYFTMELMEGGSLAAKIRGVPQPAREAAQLVVGLAEAVNEAHKSGIVHRDLKPGNILLTADGTPKITDFGLARRIEEEGGLTPSGATLGTPNYVAPEQAQGKTHSIGPAADIYSLGAILYELLTGRPPFHSPSPMETLVQAVHQEPVPITRLVPKVPRDLETICLKCLEKDPAKRYTTAFELAADLGRFLSDEPIAARRVSMAGRVWRLARRNPVPASLAGALAGIGLVAIAAIVWQWRIAERARRLADALARSEAAMNVQLREQRQNALEARERAERAGAEARQRGDAERWERYRSNIAAAAAALQLYNTGSARRDLEAAPLEHRNWEWRHLYNQVDNSRAVLRGGSRLHTFPERPVISPSGDQLATVDTDERTIKLWNAQTGAAIRSQSGHEGRVVALAFCPDGKRLASGSADRTVRLWDLEAGRQEALLRGHETQVDRVFYSPDGQHICSLSGHSVRLWAATGGPAVAEIAAPIRPRCLVFAPDGPRLFLGVGPKLCLWDTTSGRFLGELGRHEHELDWLVVSPDGRWLASHAETGNTVRLWDTMKLHTVVELAGHTVPPGVMAFSPDGSRIATGSGYPDTTVRLWQSATGRLIAELRGHKNSIASVEFDPAGRRLVSASLDQTAWLWDGVTGRPLAPLRGHTEGLTSAIFSPDGQRIITTSADQTLRLWDPAAGDLVAVLRGHSVDVRGAAFVAGGSLLVSLAGDSEVRVWDMELAERNGILRGHKSFVYDVAFSPDGTQVASAAWDGTARLWDATTGRQTGVFNHESTKAEAQIVSSVAWHPDARRFATVTRSDAIIVWDVSSRKAVVTLKAPTGDGSTGDVRAVFNSVGTVLACGSRDGTVRLWDLASGKLAGMLAAHVGLVGDLAFSPEGGQLASVGDDGTVRIWDLKAGSALKVLSAGSPGYRITYGAGGRLIAASSLDGEVRLWDARTYRELAALRHGNRAYGLAFSPDGTRLATAGADSTIRLWDVASGQEVCELRGHEAYVHAVAFSPDGTRLASASGDLTVRIWDTVAASTRARPAVIQSAGGRGARP